MSANQPTYDMYDTRTTYAIKFTSVTDLMLSYLIYYITFFDCFLNHPSITPYSKIFGYMYIQLADENLVILRCIYIQNLILVHIITRRSFPLSDSYIHSTHGVRKRNPAASQRKS